MFASPAVQVLLHIYLIHDHSRPIFLYLRQGCETGCFLASFILCKVPDILHLDQIVVDNEHLFKRINVDFPDTITREH